MDCRGPSRWSKAWRPAIATVTVCLVSVLSLPWLRARADAHRPAQPEAGIDALLAIDDTAIPDDTIVMSELKRAVTLRRREHFDRVLDAREPGELIEHATLTESRFDNNDFGVGALFVVGDELFGYLFRPENGWGSGGADRSAIDHTPRLRRVHLGAAGGPEAFGCFSCHSKGGPDGAGTQSQNAFLRGDGERIVGADQRNAPHLLGLGPIALLAREMSAELHAEVTHSRERAKTDGHRVEQPLTAKGVSFGHVTADPSGRVNYGAVEGIDRDLTIRPFGWKGHQATLRGMAEESFHLHQGLLSNRIQLAVRDHKLDPAPYGGGPWYDVDQDGTSLEIDSGMLTTMVGYLAQLEVPVIRPPRDPGLLDAWAAGRSYFDKIGCSSCHVPTLELEDTKLNVRGPTSADRSPIMVDVAKDGDGPRIEPKYAGYETSYLVHLFSDLKRHDMGDALASPDAQGNIPARMFLTRPLWGLAESAPYLHDGRAPTVHDAIVLHGGEAAAARDAYLALDDGARASLRVFLASLSREPKPFVP
jgi:hypothetical protein